MIKALLSHTSLHAVENAIRPLVWSCRLVPALVKASSAADAGSRKALHQQAAAASTTVTPNLEQRSLLAVARDLLASTAIGGLPRTPVINDHTSPEDGCRALLCCLKQLQMTAQFTDEDCDEDWNVSSPRYLGNYPELVALAGEKGMTTRKARKYLLDHPEILAKMGITPAELADMHIDHILPRCMGGRDHPCNFFVMSAKDNCSFGPRISQAKCRAVGGATVIQVVLFHLEAGALFGMMGWPGFQY